MDKGFKPVEAVVILLTIIFFIVGKNVLGFICLGLALIVIPNAFAKEVKEEKKSGSQERIEKAKAEGVACCPVCGSTSLSANTKGYGIGKAVVGAKLVGPIGLTAGNINRRKIKITCLNCGHTFRPGD